MNLFKSNVLPIIGLVTLLIFIVMSYTNNSIFLDKILICSSIFIVIFIVKASGQINRPDTRQKNDHDHRNFH